MVLYFSSKAFGQVALPQFGAKLFPYADGGKVGPDDGSLWANGSYVFPASMVPVAGQYVKILEGVTEGTGGTFDWGIRNVDGANWQLVRWYGDDVVTDADFPLYEVYEGQQMAVSIHFGFLCYDDNTSNPPQLAWCISPGGSMSFDWDDHLPHVTESKAEGVPAFDSDAKYGIENERPYSIWNYSAPDRGNIYSNSNVSSANGGASGFLPAFYTGGNSGANIGNGDYSRFGQNIGFGDGYSSGVLSCGLIAMYHPSSGELAQLAQYLTSSDFFDSLKKTWSNPLESIISLSIFPTAPPSEHMTRGSIILGGVDTGIESDKVVGADTTRWLYFGKINFSEYFKGHNFLDYDGTTVKFYLPYVGFRTVDVRDVIGCSLELRYRVDFLNGDFLAELVATSQGRITVQRNIIAERGNMSIQIPLTSRNYIGAYESAINAATSIISGNPAGVIGAAEGQKVSTQHSGSVGGSAAAMGQKRAYFIIDRPYMAEAATYGRTVGHPLEATQSLQNITGLVVADIAAADLAGMSEYEKSQIVSMFREGVIINE